MRARMAIIVLIGACAFSLNTARAKDVDINATRGQVAGACGSDFHSNLDGYGCEKPNCDHKGGTCSIECNNGGKCTGSYPGRLTGKGTRLGQILAPGDAVSLNPQPLPPKQNPSLLGAGEGATVQGPAATGTPVAIPGRSH